VSPLTLAHTRSSEDVALWTARHVLRGDGPYVDSVLGFSALGAEFRIQYTNELQEELPSLSRWLYGNALTSVTSELTSLTILLDKNSRPSRFFPPGAGVVISMEEILGVVRGMPDSQDSPDTIPWEAFRDGIELGIQVECSNDIARIRGIELSSMSQNYDNYNSICTLAIVFIRCCADFAMWTTQGSGAAGSNSSVTVDRAILLRAFSSTGFVFYPDASTIVNGLTIAFVLVGMPSKFMRWFIITFLGRLGKLYRRVLIQVFDIQQQTATMAVLLMSNSVAFLELSDVKRQGGGHPAISKGRLEERLKTVLQQRRHILDDSELSAFVSCCFKNLKEGMGDSRRLNQLLDRMRRRKPRLDDDDDDDDETDTILDIDTFNLHCSYDSAIDLDAAVQIFDRDRRRGPLERFFTPGGVHKALRTVKAAGATKPLSHSASMVALGGPDLRPAIPENLETAGTDTQLGRSSVSLEVRKNAEEMRTRRITRDIGSLQEQFNEFTGKLQAHIEATIEGGQRQQKESQDFEDRLASLEAAAELLEQRLEDRLAAFGAKIAKSSQWGEKVVNDSLDTLQHQLATLKAEVNGTKVAQSWPAHSFPEELKELLLPLETKLHDELQATAESIEVQMQLMEEKLLYAVREIDTLQAVVEEQGRSPSEQPDQNGQSGIHAEETSESHWVSSDVARMPSAHSHPRIAHMSRLPNARYRCMGL